jgi:TonB family protein
VKGVGILIGVAAVALSASGLSAQEAKHSQTPPIVSNVPALTPENSRWGKVKVIAIYAPKPDYPKYARDRHWAGTGWYTMHVDTKTGLVKWVEVTQTTGHKVLDDAVVSAFSRWRFEPGKAAPRVKSPVRFFRTSDEKNSGN